MQEPRLYNSRIISTYLEYFRNVRPEIDIEALLMESGINSYEVEDEGHWLTQQQVDDFSNALMKQTDDPSIFREAGRYMASSRAIASVRQFIVGFVTPIRAYMMFDKINLYVSRGATVETKKISQTKVRIISKPSEGVHEKPYQCENRIGAFEAVAKFFTNKLPKLEHPICLHKGDSHCEYVISWEEPAFLKWQRIRNYIAIFSIIMIFVCSFISSPSPFGYLPVILVGAVVGIFYYVDHIEKKDIYAKIETQGNAANRLLDQITDSYNSSLLVQEIGQAVSSILDIDELLKFVMDTLKKRLVFDRGMIMLANPERTRLVYVSGYGYNGTHKELLKKTEFHLDNPNSKGQFVIAFKEQKPFLIDDIKNFKEDLSGRSYEFAEALGVKSFICVPIVYEGRSEGILAVDNPRSKKPLSQSEVSLLMGIAPQIAISINNARALQRVKESEERFRALGENSPDIIYALDTNGLLTYVNPAGESIMGYSKEAIIGKYLVDFVKKEDVGIYIQLFNRIKRNKETISNFKGILLAKDGTEKFFDISGAPNLNAAGEMTGIVGTLKDYTEQHNLETQLQFASKMEELGRLTGGISHDFNNIVQAISGYNQLLMMKKSESDPDWAYLMSISKLTQRATDLIRQLLLFSRKMESKLTPLNFNLEITKFYELMAGTLPKTITLKLDLADDLHIISGDDAQLGQVMMNIMVNANDAMPDGGELTIHTRNITIETPYYLDNALIKPGKYVLLRITDTGCGIDNETLPHIFEPFFTTKEAGKGSGIGLSVVYGIIKNHNGYVFCNSEPGKGTNFEFYLPALDLTMIEGNKAIKPKETEEYLTLARGHETILLIDDEPPLLETGCDLLSFLGYDVLTAQSGEDALAVIEREKDRISLVILDLMMPGMGGEKCLAEILKILPTMKVIIASGYTANVKPQELIMEGGAAAFLHKPYRFDDLSRKIREIIDAADHSDIGRIPLHKISGV